MNKISLLQELVRLQIFLMIMQKLLIALTQESKECKRLIINKGIRPEERTIRMNIIDSQALIIC